MQSIAAECVWSDWQNCYESGWSGSGLITEASFAHPAKMALSLLQKIIRYGLDRGFWRPGDVVGDPFGGIGSTGIVGSYHGLRCILVELEPRFVELAQANFALHRPRWAVSGDPEPVIIQGDSRRFAEIVGKVAGVVSSPPYAGNEKSDYRVRDEQGLDRDERRGFRQGQGCFRGSETYGGTDGQIGSLPAGQLDAVVSSPPYAESDTQPTKLGSGKGTRADGDSAGRNKGDYIYGDSEGQIGALKSGNLDSVITSPPYADQVIRERDAGTHEPNRQGAMANGAHSCDAYGTSDGQIGQLKSGSLDAVVSSPPYAESVKGAHHERETAAESHAARSDPSQGGSLGQSQRHGGYGATAGNIGNLREGAVDAVVTSPPYGDQNDHERPLDSTRDKNGRHAISLPYGMTAGNIGNLKGIAESEPDNYWRAMSTVYRQVHQSLKPNGVMAVVLKDYCKAGKRVPLCDQTCTLLEALGFTVFERCRCWLVKEDRHPGLFDGEDVVKTTERKSFFRRLAEKRGSPRIDFEEVIWCREQANRKGPPQ